MKRHDVTDLKNRLVHLYLKPERRRCGWRLIRIRRVRLDRKGRIRTVTASMYNPPTDRWDGKPFRLDLHRELQAPSTAVLWYKRYVPLKDWLKVGELGT